MKKSLPLRKKTSGWHEYSTVGLMFQEFAVLIKQHKSMNNNHRKPLDNNLECNINSQIRDSIHLATLTFFFFFSFLFIFLSVGNKSRPDCELPPWEEEDDFLWRLLLGLNTHEHSK